MKMCGSWHGNHPYYFPRVLSGNSDEMKRDDKGQNLWNDCPLRVTQKINIKGK